MWKKLNVGQNEVNTALTTKVITYSANNKLKGTIDVSSLSLGYHEINELLLSNLFESDQIQRIFFFFTWKEK